MAPQPRHGDLLLDLNGIEPAPDRLLEIVDASLTLPCERIVVDWGGRFPFRVDASVVRTDAFPEALVAAVDERCRRAGVALSIVVADALPEGYSGRASYRHLERARTRPSSEWRAAARKTVCDLLDDMAELVPALDSVAVVAGTPDLELVRDAATESGLAVRTVESAARPDPDVTGGVEERLERDRHPSARDGMVGVHDSLRAWRLDAWRLVGAAHEEVVRASGDASLRGRRLAGAIRALAAHTGRTRAIRARFADAYAGLASERALRAYLSRVFAPVREQYGQLAARAASLRSR